MKQNALATRTIRRLRGLRAVPGAVPPVGLVVLGILSVQVGAAFAKALFPVVGAIWYRFPEAGFRRADSDGSLAAASTRA